MEILAIVGVVIVALVAFVAGYWVGAKVGFTWGFGFGRFMEFLHIEIERQRR